MRRVTCLAIRRNPQGGCARPRSTGSALWTVVCPLSAQCYPRIRCSLRAPRLGARWPPRSRSPKPNGNATSMRLRTRWTMQPCRSRRPTASAPRNSTSAGLRSSSSFTTSATNCLRSPAECRRPIPEVLHHLVAEPLRVAVDRRSDAPGRIEVDGADGDRTVITLDRASSSWSPPPAPWASAAKLCDTMLQPPGLDLEVRDCAPQRRRGHTVHRLAIDGSVAKSLGDLLNPPDPAFQAITLELWPHRLNLPHRA